MTVHDPGTFRFALVPAHPPEFYLDNVRYALSLGLTQLMPCAPHDRILSVAGGGPSIEDTYSELTGYVAAINGSLAYLTNKGVVPAFCGVCDPTEKIADMLEARQDVTYVIASCAHRSVFDKLIAAGCKIFLYHVREIEGIVPLLDEHYKGQYETIPGGCTMGLRWVTLGYYLGFRKFHLHGLDSSFRNKSSHAYPDPQDSKEWIVFDDYPTRVNFIGQVTDFLSLMNDSRGPGTEPIEIKMFGDGLLQSRYRRWLEDVTPKPGPFLMKKAERLNIVACQIGNYCGRGWEYVTRLFDSIEKHSPLLAFRPWCITDDWDGIPEGIMPIKPDDGATGWWNKVALFRPDALPKGERCLYFDLDTVITGDITAIASFHDRFAMLRDTNFPTHANSSIMAWEAGTLDHIWQRWLDTGKPQFGPTGDQKWIEQMEPRAALWQDFLPGQIVDYKVVALGGGVPEDTRVIHFHGKPRPHETELWK